MKLKATNKEIDLEECQSIEIIDEPNDPLIGLNEVLSSDLTVKNPLPDSFIVALDEDSQTLEHEEMNIVVSVKEPTLKIEITDDQREQLIQRLESLIRKSYAAWDSVQGPKLAYKDHKIRLVTEGKTLFKGFYVCTLCKKDISVVYTTDRRGKFKQWVNSNMKRHLLRIHSHDGQTKNK